MWILSGFADEISPDLGEQLTLLNTLGVRHVEFRSAWGTEVLAPHLERARHAMAVAHQMGTTYIRVFSFFIQLGDDPATRRDDTCGSG